MTITIVFVCRGNICRSPAFATAASTALAPLEDFVSVRSAGSADWCAGRPRHAPMVAAAARHDLKMDSALSEKLGISMVDASTLLIPLDTEVERAVRTEIAALKDEPAVLPASVVCFPDGVRDPYGGSEKDFDEVVNLALLFADRLLIALSDLAAKESVADPVHCLTRMLSNF